MPEILNKLFGKISVALNKCQNDQGEDDHGLFQSSLPEYNTDGALMTGVLDIGGHAYGSIE